MKSERRWLKSIIAASAEPLVALPWTRGKRCRPEAMKLISIQADLWVKPRAIAAH